MQVFSVLFPSLQRGNRKINLGYPTDTPNLQVQRKNEFANVKLDTTTHKKLVHGN